MTDQQMTSSGSGRMGSGGVPSMDVSVRSPLGQPGPSTDQGSSGQSSRAAERRVANSVIRSALRDASMTYSRRLVSTGPPRQVDGGAGAETPNEVGVPTGGATAVFTYDTADSS